MPSISSFGKNRFVLNFVWLSLKLTKLNLGLKNTKNAIFIQCRMKFYLEHNRKSHNSLALHVYIRGIHTEKLHT